MSKFGLLCVFVKDFLAHKAEGSGGAYSMGLEPASVRVCVRPCVHTFKHEYL